MARSFSGSATEIGIGDQLGVGQQASVSMTRRPAARSARPVSVISTTASATSGIFASVAPKEKRTSACTPRSVKETLGERRVLGRYPAAVREVLDLLHRRVPADGEHDFDGLGRHLGVLQLAEADDLGARLLDPVATRHAEVEQALGDVDMGISWGRRMCTSSMRGSSIVAR